MPLPVIQCRLGHESIQSTVGTYGHILPDAALVAAGAVERAMGELDPNLVHVGELECPLRDAGLRQAGERHPLGLAAVEGAAQDHT